MSEYQYLEFLAIDRPLTEKQVDDLRNISTRAQITPVSFVNEYNWSGLKADPVDFMRHYFDLHVFLAEWGDAIFMVRLPKESLEKKILEAFCSSPYLKYEVFSDYCLLTWSLEVSDDYERFAFIEDTGWMPRLAPLREELLRGDLRSLYIGWLRYISNEDGDPKELEPMVIEGMGQLTAAQHSLAEFLEIDIDLLAGAGSGQVETRTQVKDDASVDVWLDSLSRDEIRGYLRQMVQGQGAQAERVVKREYGAWQRRTVPTQSAPRSVGQLWQLAKQAQKIRLIEENRAQKQAEAEQQQKRNAWLAQLAADFPRAWRVAHQYAGKGHASAYDTACQQLVDLRDAYKQHDSATAFQHHLHEFRMQHQRRRALLQRLDRAGLHS
nr:hypothetical protein [uncultured Desulfobulbus sp.]